MATPPLETGYLADFSEESPMPSPSSQKMLQLDTRVSKLSLASQEGVWANRTDTEVSPRTAQVTSHKIPRRGHTRERSRSMSSSQPGPQATAVPLPSPRRLLEQEKLKTYEAPKLHSEQPSSSSTTTPVVKNVKATNTDDSNEASSSSSSQRQPRSRRLSLAERANSVFFTKLNGNASAAKAYATDALMRSATPSDSRPRELSTKSSSSFLARLLPSFSSASKTEVEKAKKAAFENPNLKNWLDLRIDLPPIIFASCYRNIAETVALVLSNQEKLCESQTRESVASELVSILEKSADFAFFKSRKKELKWSLECLKARDYSALLEVKTNLEALLSAQDLSSLLKLWEKDKSLKFVHITGRDREDLETFKALLRLKFPLIESLLKAVSSEQGAILEEQKLKQELSLVKAIILCDSVDEARQEIQEDVEKAKKTAEGFLQQISQLQAKIETAYVERGNFQSVATRIFGTKNWKDEVQKQDSFIKSQAVVAELVKMMVNKQASHHLEEISNGSGEIYKIFWQEEDSQPKPIFVFKPQRGAPGMPQNKKDNGPAQLKVCGNRSLQPARMAFPVDEGVLREYAVGLLGFAPMRFLTALPLPDDDFKVLQPGLVMEYVPHLFSITDLLVETKRQLYKSEIKALEEQQKSLKQKDSSGEPSNLEECRKLENSLSMATNRLATLAKEKKLSQAQKELVEACSIPETDVKLSGLPIWKVISQESLFELVAYSLQVPDMDRNADNILISRRKGKNSGKNIYRVAIIDADQAFPDSWKGLESINAPAWLNSAACNFPLVKIRKHVMALDASKMLQTFKEHGLFFQEREKSYRDLHEDGKEYKLGGDLFDILHAFHTVAKVGLINKNTANQVGAILFDTMPRGHAFNLLHHLFLQSKEFANTKAKAKELLATSDYLAFMTNPDYACLDSVELPAGQEREQWKLFEALVLQTLTTKFNKPANLGT